MCILIASNILMFTYLQASRSTAEPFLLDEPVVSLDTSGKDQTAAVEGGNGPKLHTQVNNAISLFCITDISFASLIREQDS